MGQRPFEQSPVPVVVRRFKSRQSSRPGEAHAFAFGALLNLPAIRFLIFWGFGFGLTFADLVFY